MRASVSNEDNSKESGKEGWNIIPQIHSVSFLGIGRVGWIDGRDIHVLPDVMVIRQRAGTLDHLRRHTAEKAGEGCGSEKCRDDRGFYHHIVANTSSNKVFLSGFALKSVSIGCFKWLMKSINSRLSSVPLPSSSASCMR